LTITNFQIGHKLAIHKKHLGGSYYWPNPRRGNNKGESGRGEWGGSGVGEEGEKGWGWCGVGVGRGGGVGGVRLLREKGHAPFKSTHKGPMPPLRP
jgi:hypothetical protein